MLGRQVGSVKIVGIGGREASYKMVYQGHGFAAAAQGCEQTWFKVTHAEQGVGLKQVQGFIDRIGRAYRGI